MGLTGAQFASAEEIRDYYSEPGLNPFKDALNQNLNEHIDPFSGTLQLKYTDITVPGNGGMDININRVYTSLQDTSLPLLGINGVGWVMHFGRIVTTQRHADKLCAQSRYSTSTNDNPSLELPDGGRELLVLDVLDDDGSLITRSNWKARCVAGQQGLLVTSPDGTQYTMSHATFLQGEPSWMTTRIEDVHGNWIRIEYATNAAGISYITEIYRSEEGSSSPVVTYEYQNQNSAGIKLSAITANGQRWQYFYEPITGYLYDHYQQLVAVERPDGRRWQYAYNPAPQDPNPGDGVVELTPGGFSLRQLIYPHGATVDYRYQYVQFDPGSALKTTAVQTKAVSGSAVASGQWQFSFAPFSRPFTTDNGYTLRYDVTTVTAPDAIYRYVHHGKDYTGKSGGGQVFIRPAVVGLLAFKEIYSLANVLKEKRAYTWFIRLISEENFWHGAGYRDWWMDQGTFAAMPAGEGYNRDSTASNDSYQHVIRYADYDAYGNPGRIYEKSNLEPQSDRQTTFTYHNDVARWILGLPLTETHQIVQGPDDSSPTTVGVITRSYFSNGKLESENKFGVTTEYTYTSAGDVASVRDARGFTREYSDYRRGIARREELPESVVLLRSVNPTGTLQSQTNGRGFTTSFSYDTLNRLTGIDYPINADLTIAYDASGGSSRRTLTRGNYRQTELINDFGQTVRTERSDQLSGQVIYKTHSFDALGRQTFISYPNSTIGLTTTFDPLGRILRTEHPDGSRVSYTYDDQQVVVLNERDSRTEYIYLIYGANDASQLPYFITQDRNVGTIIGRDSLGNTTSVMQGTRTGNTVTGYAKTYTYDSRKFLTRIDEPEVGKTVFTHDALGNVLTETVNAEAATNFAWDGLGRRVSVDFGDAAPDVTTIYDRNGNVSELTKGSSRWNYVYDSNDNLQTETLRVQDRWFGARTYVLAYTHDAMDVVASVTYPSGLAVQYAPDAFGRATRVGTFATEVSYHPSGQLASYTLGNGVRTSVALNRRLLTQRIQAGSVVDLTYTYDTVGNVSSITDAITPSQSVLSNGYDGLERLYSSNHNGNTLAFEYDVWGNLRARHTPIHSFRYTIQSRRLAQVDRGPISDQSGVSDSTQFSYDARGNVISKRVLHLYGGQGLDGFVRTVDTRLRFDAASHLTAAEIHESNRTPVTRRSYAYDGNGMRYAEREGKGYSLRHSIYGASGVLLFEDSFGECARTDVIVLGALNLAKSRDDYANPALDTDGDGLNNCVETQLGLSPNNAADAAGDLDNDGLTNLQEFTAGSSPLFADTDADGLSDAVEVAQHGTDPFEPDGDGDGIPDADELLDSRLDPTLADTDHDGVTDPWELRLASDPSNPLDGVRDFDSDGFSNRQERWTNVDPLLRASTSNRGATALVHDVGSAVQYSPALGRDGTIYVTHRPPNGNTGHIEAIYPDGERRWRYSAAAVATGPTTVGPDGTIYFWMRPQSIQPNVPTSVVYALNPNGTLLWKFETFSHYLNSPISLRRDGHLIVGGRRTSSFADGEALILDRNGQFVDSKAMPNDVLRAPIVAPNGAFYILSGTGVVYAYSADRVQQWTYTLRSPAAADPSLGDGGMLYITDSAGYVSALRPDGTLAWEQRPSTTAPRSGVTVGAGGVLYHGTSIGALIAMSATDGTTIWSLQPPSGSTTALFTPALGSDGTVLAASVGGRVFAADATGRELWSVLTGNALSSAPVLDRDGTLYVGTGRGQVLTFVDSNGGPARTPWPMARHDSAGTSFRCFDSTLFSVDVDTDGDGIDDCDELAVGLDPSDPADGALDLDGDGLSNSAEQTLGTRLNVADTDGDGLSDGHEVNAFHTDPLSSDSDRDTLNDGYEVQYQFDPLDPADAVADADGDGYSNRQEMFAGSDPLSLSSMPTAGAIAKTQSRATFPVRQPAVHPDGTIFMNGPNQLEAREPDLSLRWARPGALEGHVAIGANGIAYAVLTPASGPRKLVALYSDHTLWWSAEITDSTATSFDGPVIGNDGTVYVSYRSTRIFPARRIDAFSATGEYRTSVALAQVAGDFQHRLSIDAQGNVLSTYPQLRSLNPQTLQTVWTSSVPAGLMSVPVVDSNGSIYVTLANGLYAVSAASGTTQWSRNNATGQPVMTTNGLIIVKCTSNGQLCAYDRSGTLIWQMTSSFPLTGTPTVDANNVIHQVTSSGAYVRVSGAGALLSQASIPSTSVFEYPAILSDGMVYLGMAGADVLALNNARGTVNSPWPLKNRDGSSRRNATAAPIGPVAPGPSLTFTSELPSFKYYYTSVVVSAVARDLADGDVSANIQWSSSRDGALGRGASVNLQPLTAGSHTITASITDSDGHIATARFNVAVETQAPSLTITSPAGFSADVEVGTPVQLTAMATDLVDGDISSQVIWRVGSTQLGLGSPLTVTLAAGEHNVSARVTNSLGLQASRSVLVRVRRLEPVVNITSPSNGQVVSPGSSITFSGTATDGVDGNLSGQLRWISSLHGLLHVGDTFTTSTLSLGGHTIYADAIDSHRGVGTASVVLHVMDTNVSHPWINSISSNRSQTNVGQSVTFSASGFDNEDGALTNVQWFSNRDGSLGSGSPRTISTLSAGTHRIHAYVTDSSGARGGTFINHIVRPLSSLNAPSAAASTTSSPAPLPVPEVPLRIERRTALVPSDPWNSKRSPLISMHGEAP